MRLYLKCSVALGAFVVCITELLSLFHALTRPALIAVWILALICVPPFVRKPKFVRLDFFDASLVSIIALILAILAFIALKSPPNTTDAMMYHLPRVLFWAQQRSVSFFATTYLNQITLQPFAEYLMLQTYVVSGGDHFVNLIQWFGCVNSIVGVAAIAGQFGATRRGRLMAALFCATLPNGIMQASGAKNDYVLAGWLCATAYFLLIEDPLFTGLALGLALGTKAIAYLFAPPLILAIVIPMWRSKRPAIGSLATIGLCVLALNAPQYIRNIRFSGSPLGPTSPFGNDKFISVNSRFGLRATVSNALRNFTEQLGTPNERWNRGLYDAVVRIHQKLGIDPNDPADTITGGIYEPPRNANHETSARNAWRLPILAICFCAMPWRSRRLFLYLCGLIAGFIVFCAYLKWEPFMGRMFLPLLVLASPAIIVVRPPILQLALAVLLLDTAKPYLLENWVRPLKGPNSLLKTSRDDQYFNDLHPWNMREPTLEAVDAAARSGCNLIGIDINEWQLEYPFEALLRERNPKVQFVHVNVQNPSKKY